MRMNRKKKTKDAEAEVDELLKAVEDEMLLNLSVNSHISTVSPDCIDSDLDRRFRALKSHSSSSSSAPPPPPEAVLAGDLAARFAALQATLPNPDPPKVSLNDQDDDDDEDEDEQVEKLIRWAKDAARLDPSPPSDDDDELDNSDADGSEDEEDDRPAVK